MKERPILMSAPMVLAILDGRKTQTRRVVNRLRKFGSFSGPITEFDVSDTEGYDRHFRDKGMRWHDMNNDRVIELCPHGIPGDQLWIRETFARIDDESGFGSGYTEYKASCNYPEKIVWTPSICMPRWASRILLEITDVRVERLQDISEEDAIAEGCFKFPFEDDHAYTFYEDDKSGHATHTGAYRKLWESINGKGSWSANPFVWCINFKRI